MKRQMRGGDGRYIPRSERIRILKKLGENSHDREATALQLGIAVKDVDRAVKHRALNGQHNPYRLKAVKEKGLRERLYEKAVLAVEEGIGDPTALIRTFLESEGIPATEDFVGVYLSYLSKRTGNAIKILEGLPDGLVKQGEVKHTGDVNHHQTIIIQRLREGRERVARLRADNPVVVDAMLVEEPCPQP